MERDRTKGGWGGKSKEEKGREEGLHLHGDFHWGFGRNSWGFNGVRPLLKIGWRPSGCHRRSHNGPYGPEVTH